MPIGSDIFIEPTSLDEAEKLKAGLTSDVQTIQAQLGDKQRVDDDGRRLSAREYWTWKKRAQHALNQKLEDLRAVKLWIRDNRQDAPHEPLASEAVTHATNLYKILEELVSDGVELEKDEATKTAAAQVFLRRIGNI